MVNRRRMNQRGGVESEGATFMSSRFFEATAPSSNAETVTSGNGSFPPMNEHNLITGIPLKAAPGSTALMGGRRRRNQRGGVESEGATFMSSRFFEATAPSSNAETVTSGNGSFPPMNEHNLITGIPLKAAPGSTALMGGRRRRNMRGGEGEVDEKNSIVAEIAVALKNLSMEDLNEIKSAIITSNASNANAVANAATELSTNVNATMPNTQVATDVAALAEAATNSAVKASNTTTVPEAMAAANEAANLAANAVTTVANAVNNTAVTKAANAVVDAVANGNLEKVPENVAEANAALPASNSLTGGKRRRNNKKSSKKSSKKN